MPIIIEAMNLAGSIGAIISWPPLLIFAMAYVTLRTTGRDMQQKWKPALYGLLIIGSVGYALDLSDRFGLIAYLENFVPLEKVYDQTFENERVLLDGHSYNHCHFINVTFVTNGARFELVNNQIGPFSIATDRRDIEGALAAMNGLGALKFPLKNKQGKIIPAYGENPRVGPPVDGGAPR